MSTNPAAGVARCCRPPRVIRAKLAALSPLLLIALYGAHPALAADPQPYRVELLPTEDRALDVTLKATSELLTLRTSAPVGPFGLIGRAKADVDRLKTVLESYGYYQGGVSITIDALPLDDTQLGDELTSREAKNEARVKVSFELGPLYHLRRIDIDGELPDEVRGALGLSPGAPAVAADVLAAGERLLTALEDRGYAFAKVDPPVAYEDPAGRVLDVRFHVVTDSKVRIGDIRLRGLKDMHEQFVRKRLLVHSGEQYSASRIEQARKDLLGMGVFSSVSVRVGASADAAGAVPIAFQIRERPLHAVSLTAAYSSDLGGSTGVNWVKRNVSGRADSLTLSASAINLGGGTATNGIGYDTSAKYLIPDFGRRDQSLQVGLGALKQSLQAYDQTAGTFSLTLNRKLSSIWSGSVGFTYEQERIIQDTVLAQEGAAVCASTSVGVSPGPPTCRTTFHYALLTIPFNVLYNTTGLDSPLEDALHGIRASLSIAPTLSVGHPSTRFLISQASISTYIDLEKLKLNNTPGRSVLALRALAGLAAGAGEFSLPPDQRFYAGGSGTIRGYRYQSVGPLFATGNPIGGTAINAGSAEFRQRIGTNFGAAFFLDAGQVSSNLNPMNGTLRFGTGAGVRYYTPIGPIRFDIAVPLERRGSPPHPAGSSPGPGDDSFEIYIGLGQAF